jgi:adenylosuccinate lyase
VVRDLAGRHERTAMPGRTHAQPGAPISLAFKLAGWADELGRHLERLHDGRRRWATAQLGGAVGTLGFYGEVGPALRARFAERLGLADPGMAWFSSRDRVAEFGTVMAGITGTLARIGNEVMELQRPEIGELRETTSADVVGSIMMPHKRNPEASEHLDTLARLTRASAAVLLEAQVDLHERDGRSWKAEWVALPEVCLLTATSLRLAIQCVEGLEVDAARMAANTVAAGGVLGSERILGVLSARMGKHRAQAALHDLLADAGRDERSLADAVQDAGLLTEAEASAALADPIAPGDTAAVRSVFRRLGAR